MSLSLLKRSLAIVEENLPDNKSKKTKLKDKQEETKKWKASKRRGIFRPNAKEPKKKMSIEEIRRNACKADKVEENIAKLQMLSKATVKLDEKAQKKIIDRAQTGHYVIPEEVKKVEESIFTEEDFKKFEEEYFG